MFALTRHMSVVFSYNCGHICWVRHVVDAFKGEIHNNPNCV